MGGNMQDTTCEEEYILKCAKNQDETHIALTNKAISAFI